MSPRAAWRLERMGFEVYDYVSGKADWLAAGLPTVAGSTRPARVAGQLSEARTCPPDAPAADAAGYVVVNERGVVLGVVPDDPPTDADQTATAEDVMKPGPSTERADADPDDLRTRMAASGKDSYLITTPDGVLLGVFTG